MTLHLGRSLSHEEQVDHINGDPFDNRLVNLRLASNSENSRNQAKRSAGHPIYKGIVPARTAGKWWARVKYNYRFVFLGTHDTAEAAARAYDEGAKQYFGQFARLNFPGETP